MSNCGTVVVANHGRDPSATKEGALAAAKVDPDRRQLAELKQGTGGGGTNPARALLLAGGKRAPPVRDLAGIF